MQQPSLVTGASAPALLDGCIGEALAAAARRWPDQDALIVRHQDIRWSYAELFDKVEQLAAALIDIGLEPGDRVGVWSQNNSEWVLAQFATAMAGIIQVNINPAYRTHELEHALKKTGCRAIILSPYFRTSSYVDILRELAPEIAASKAGELRSQKLPDLQWAICLGHDVPVGMIAFPDLMASASQHGRERVRAIASTLRPDDSINIQFTSGTTGTPKGAALTHRNILNNGFFVGQGIKLNSSDRLCLPVPLYHCFGMVMANLACITHGACMVQPAEHFDAQLTLDAVAAERCTVLYGVPTMFIAMLDHPSFEQYDLSSLRTGIMAGSPCPPATMRKVMDLMNMKEVTIAYGMTETSPVSFQSSTEDPVELRINTVGRIHPHLEAKVVNNLFETLPVDQTGELVVRGYSVMAGYWGDDAATQEAIRDGWMHTGDLASIDSDGYCQIVGRSKDMVIRGGENIYPAEVESFLHSHPKIRDVQCIGIPDDRFGEELCACVIVQQGEVLNPEEIVSFCKGRISHYKIPRYIEFVESFPLTVTGKVQKFLLRETICRKIGI
ncbi:AMP-binding protein [Sphingobium xenophagum]|nr:AMP-binding protein [Sphingobium xenophagum]